MKVFYRPEQNCNEANSYSPSASKPALVIQDWLTSGLITNDDIIAFEPLTDAVIAKAHDPYYVAGILNGTVENGFGNTSSVVAESLLYTTGSLLAAAEYAIAHRTHTCSPTSGFHHAGHAFSGGFCTFNGLAVAAVALKHEGYAKWVGILDLDMHFGNGTADIINRKKIDYVTQRSQGDEFHTKEDAGRDTEKYFDWLESSIHYLRGCDVILYQAGADPHVDDPLGGLLTTEQMRKRDALVFDAFKGKPLVWNLAGGYQRDKNGSIAPVLDLHRNTVIECIKALDE